MTRPPLILPDRYDQVLALVRAGRPMAEVASTLGVSRATLYNTAGRDTSFGNALRKAQEAARRERKAATKRNAHGTESCYVKAACRCPECTAAASRARARRRGTSPTVYDLAALPPPLADSA